MNKTNRITAFFLAVAMVVVLIPAMNTSVIAKESYIPVAFDHFNGHTYAIYDVGLTYKKAQEYCESMGGHLAIVSYQKNKEEANFITSTLIYNNGKKDFYWTGGDGDNKYAQSAMAHPNPDIKRVDRPEFQTTYTAGEYYDKYYGFICAWDFIIDLSTVTEPTYTYVTDNANVLSKETKEHIESKNTDLHRQNKTEFVVCIVKSTNGVGAIQYGEELFKTWAGIGIKNDGLLLVLSIDEDDYAIAHGIDLKGKFTEDVANELFNKCLEPYFVKKEYDKGVRAIFDAGVAWLIDGSLPESSSKDIFALTSNDITISVAPTCEIGQDIKVKANVPRANHINTYFQLRTSDKEDNLKNAAIATSEKPFTDKDRGVDGTFSDVFHTTNKNQFQVGETYYVWVFSTFSDELNMLVPHEVKVIKPVRITAPVNNDESIIKVFLNGKKIIFDQPSIIENGRTLVPIRAIAEAMGAEVEWDYSANKAIINYGSMSMHLLENVNSAQIMTKRSNGANCRDMSLDVPMRIVNNRTLVPVRFIAEAFGANVEWRGEENAVYITTKDIKTSDILAQFAQFAYSPDDIFDTDKLMRDYKLGRTDLIGWAVEDTFEDSKTSFGTTIFKKGNEIVFAVRGTVDWEDNILYLEDLINGSDKGHIQVEPLMNYINSKLEKYLNDSSNTFYFTGHSLGGYLTYWAVARARIINKQVKIERVETFNGLGLYGNSINSSLLELLGSVASDITFIDRHTCCDPLHIAQQIYSGIAGSKFNLFNYPSERIEKRIEDNLHIHAGATINTIKTIVKYEKYHSMHHFFN